MRNVLAGLVLLLLTAPLLFAGGARMAREQDDPMIGQSAPQAALYDANGRAVSLSQLRGRPAVLIFFPPGQPDMLQDAERLLKEHGNGKAAGVAIAMVRGREQKAGADRGENPEPSQRYGKIGANRKGKRGNQQPRIPPALIQQLSQVQTSLPILFDLTGEVSRALQAMPNSMVLLDEKQLVRARTLRAQPAAMERFQEQLALLTGEAPERYGWRTDLVFALETALGERDARGKRVELGKSKGMVPPQQALRELRLLSPPTELSIKSGVEQAAEELRKPLQEAFDFAKKEWEKALPEVKFSVVQDRDDADLIITFMTEVLDPRDPNGLRTVCANFRTLDEEARGKGKPVGKGPNRGNEHRIKTIAQIGFGHTRDGVRHTQQAVAHLIGAAIGYALGLDDRMDPTSIMHPRVDKGSVALRPSKDDLAILKNLKSALHYYAGKIMHEQGRTAQAKEEFAKIAADSRYVRQAKELVDGSEGKSEPRK